MLTLDQALVTTSTDALVVLHKGSVVLERYFNGMTERSPHIFMSISKSMLGLIAGILADRQALDVSRPAPTLIPELKTTAWAGATVMQLLDMRMTDRPHPFRRASVNPGPFNTRTRISSSAAWVDMLDFSAPIEKSAVPADVLR